MSNVLFINLRFEFMQIKNKIFNVNETEHFLALIEINLIFEELLINFKDQCLLDFSTFLEINYDRIRINVEQSFAF